VNTLLASDESGTITDKSPATALTVRGRDDTSVKGSRTMNRSSESPDPAEPPKIPLPKPHKGQVGHVWIDGKCVCGEVAK
jgi:hypothetical protein